MVDLSEDAHVIAVDLPGIGDSQGLPRTNDKRTLASYVASLVGGLGLLDVTLVGHDVGGQIVYSYLRFDSGPLRKAVIMNVVVPGVDPWTEVKRNSKIWHFAFHAVPDLPEKLVWGQQRAYFDYFYDAISARKDGVKEDARKAYANAYSRREALHVGFEWYRAFAQDVKDNLSNTEPPVDTPVLYLRGDHEGDIQNYLEGFYESGLLNVQGCVIPECGHFAPDEQPGQVGKALRNFIFG